MKMFAQQIRYIFQRIMRGDQQLQKTMSLEERQYFVRHVLMSTMIYKGPVKFFFHTPYIFESVTESFLREWKDYLNWSSIWDYYETPSKNFVRQFKKAEQ